MNSFPGISSLSVSGNAESKQGKALLLWRGLTDMELRKFYSTSAMDKDNRDTIIVWKQYDGINALLFVSEYKK